LQYAANPEASMYFRIWNRLQQPNEPFLKPVLWNDYRELSFMPNLFFYYLEPVEYSSIVEYSFVKRNESATLPFYRDDSVLVVWGQMQHKQVKHVQIFFKSRGKYVLSTWVEP
jgi:hypothetical protein